MLTNLRLWSWSAALVSLCISGARAQCLDWDTSFAYATGFIGPVWVLAPLDTGSGPELYVGGEFTTIAGVTVNGVAKWNGTSWSPLGSGMDANSFYPPAVRAFAVFDDGSGPAVYAAGYFDSAGGSPAKGIAKWDGTSWQAVGNGLTYLTNLAEVSALSVFDDGSGPALYAGGRFDKAGALTVHNIARWNGSAWSDVGGGTSDPVAALALFDDGNGPALYAAGSFGSAGSTVVHSIARWNGSTWGALAGGLLQPPINAWVSALEVFDDGSGPALYAGGMIETAGGVPVGEVAKWNGVSWSAAGLGVSGQVRTLKAFDDGGGAKLYAGGAIYYLVNGPAAQNLAVFDGTSWSMLGSGVNSFVQSLCAFDLGSGPTLLAGGSFFASGHAAVDHVGQWNGTSWSTIGHPGQGADGIVRAFCAWDDGTGPSLYAGGDFLITGGAASRHVAKWNGNEWSTLGNGINWQAATVDAMAVYDPGSGASLCVAGGFPIDSFGSPNVARWDGSGWYPMGAGLSHQVNALAVFDGGSGPELYAGGVFSVIIGGPVANGIAKWNGSMWSAIGNGMGGTVNALAVHNNALYAGGTFNSANGVPASYIARWNGSSWSALGSGTNGFVLSLFEFDDGSGSALYVGGAFMSAGGVAVNRIARWDGSTWSAVGSGFDGTVATLGAFDDGSGPALYAGGDFAISGANTVDGIAKWNGTSWVALGSGLSPGVRALAEFGTGPNGAPALFVGGSFTTAGAIPSSRIARWHGCENPIDTFCFGDGSVANCPCSNSGLPGHGCENSAATGGARLFATGTTTPDTLVLHAAGELPSVLSIFLQGNALVSGTARFGDGLRCAGGSLKRLYAKNAMGGAVAAPAPGDPSISTQSAALGDPIAPGSTRYYQTYYRDSNLNYCPPPQGDAWNVTNGVKVVW